MKRWALPLMLLALLPGTLDAQQRRPYVDPALRALLRPEARAAVERAPAPDRVRDRRTLPLGGEIALDRSGPGGAARVGVLVKLREPIPAALARLRAAGAQVGTVVGDIATARVPVDALPRLTSAVELERLEAARVLEAVHDSSTLAIRAHEVRKRDGGHWYGSAGHGVVVGVYDTGLDYRHGDFRDAEGRTRLGGLWDQTSAGTPPTGYGYGHYCDRASLGDGGCPQADVSGHGTHVAGSAAGDGSDAGSRPETAYRYAGVAPAADILVVKGGNSSFETNRIIDGVDWLFSTAAALGKPAVVNLSLGGQFGPRDGTSLFEQALDNLTGPGRILVVAAGNHGQNGNTTPATSTTLFHAHASLTTGGTREFTFTIPSYNANSGTCNDVALIDIWYEGGDAVDLTVVRPGGSEVAAAHGTETEQDHAQGYVAIDNASTGPNPRNADYEALVEIGDCGATGATPASGSWKVRAHAATATSGLPLHLWISYSRFGDERARGSSANFDNGYVISSPGTAREALTVAAFVTRVCWPTASSSYCYREKEEVGDIARFSAAGPTRDGRLKPDLAAPGMGIISALSRSARAPGELVAPDGRHWLLQGTSMAAPHVAGAVALLLQHSPTLTPADVRAVFERSAARDAFTSRSYSRLEEPAGTPNYQWGQGKLDVRAAVEDVADPMAVAGVLVTPSRDSVAVQHTVQLQAQPFNGVGDTIDAAVVWSSSDPTIATVDQNGLVTGIGRGDAVISATADGKSGTADITVVPPVAAVHLSPAGDTLVAGEPRQFTVRLEDAEGNELSGREVAWTSTDSTVVQVDRTGLAQSRAVGNAAIVATAEEKSDTAQVLVVAPSTLVVEAEAAPAATVASSEKGTRVPLMRLRLRVDGPEAMRLGSAGLKVAGDDPEARLLMVHDRDHDASIDDGEPIVGSASAALEAGSEPLIIVYPTGFDIAAGDSASVVLALELSGKSPNGTSFSGSYEPSATQAYGLRSGQGDRLQQSDQAVASLTVESTVLRPDEVFALSENPVRSDHVIFNFRERPQTAGVYTLNGARVADLLARMEDDARVVWDLTNDRGTGVAAGVYLVVFRVAGELVREKLIIVRPSGGKE